MDQDVVLRFDVPGNPVAHGRPRFGRNGHAYTDNTSRGYKQEIAWRAKAAGFPTPNEHQRFAIKVSFYRSNRQRIDVDNLLKSVLDGCTMARVWVDDSQVRQAMVTLLVSQPQPRAEIEVSYFADPSPVHLCARCNLPISQSKSRERKYCSTVCASLAKRTKKKCTQCGSDFSVPNCVANRQRFCCRPCSLKYYAVARKAAGRMTWRCVVCGGPVSRKEYNRCRGCAMKARKADKSNLWSMVQKGEGKP